MIINWYNIDLFKSGFCFGWYCGNSDFGDWRLIKFIVIL